MLDSLARKLEVDIEMNLALDDWQVAIFADLLTQEGEFGVQCVFWKGNFSSGDGVHLEAAVDAILDENLNYTP